MENIHESILENERIYWYDNLKFFLMVLVVIGHGADYGTSQYASFRFAYLFVYIFHMPLFLFIFSRQKTPTS